MSAKLIKHTADDFAAAFGRSAQGVAFVPGRVNLIGEHVDYNYGLVLPMPVREGTAVAWSPADHGEIAVRAANLDASDRFAAFEPSRLTETDWRSYARGMVAHLDLPPGTGLDLLVRGDLPRGSGLSSSASFCVALGRAVSAALGLDLDARALAKAAQSTEHDWAGVACGIMDQMAVAAGEAGKALLLDCRTLDYEQFELPSDWAVAIVDSGVTRGLVDGEYNLRRQQCEAAARKIGVASLRDADRVMLESAGLNELEFKRALHVVEEIDRVEKATQAIMAADLSAMASILREGHASLRDLFEVSIPAVDQLAERIDNVLQGRGAARMTGAGFGGSVVVIAERAALPDLERDLDRPVRPVF
ncbi:galactokinase [Qipengyuania nanhaisediminis]|uniref:Galactokinase n=1 Tax=Qipengyuania nanhaisediminis TaxID=604088 RepID=A0A1I5LF77_9SPHN|nr:galactokinase [Qipengyuania nanhaisediminis]SFO95867.1 galactokinase [Qipengyuania nanhaisediminis]